VAKYRQHGYKDGDFERGDRGEGRERDKRAADLSRKILGAEKPAPPSKKDLTFGPRPVNMPGTRDVSRCAQCGAVLQFGMTADQKCPKCGFELHSCKQCMYFDPGSRFECMQPVKERVAKKDTRNECTFYEMRVTREKETGTPVNTSSTASQKPGDARAAFDSLFKK
jgi:predicted RNA-binding Zn-ribbon protein involved in translation (DUF1610 family)